MPLYHYSEDPTITVFEPRAPLAHRDAEPLVWALDEWHKPMYLTPRDCPRVLFWPLPSTTAGDRERWWTGVADRIVLAIEAAWFERLHTTTLYRYVLPDESFTSLNDAGMHISRSTVVPLAVEQLGNLIDEIRKAEAELRVCSSLVPLGKAIITTTLHYSLIRMRNAHGWDGPPAGPAVPKAPHG